MIYRAETFLEQPHKAVTLMGMSGVGKTTLASILGESGWFHYSADYRIGAEYLDGPVIENIRAQAMAVPFVRDLLESGTIRFQNNVTIDNLKPVSTFLGMIGNPESGGMPEGEFRRRQELYKQAEIRSMFDVPSFIEKARDQYGQPHFLCDSTGSLCELDNREVLETLSAHTLILYLKASEKDEKELFERALAYPKPLFYPEAFFRPALKAFMAEEGLEYVALIEPDDFYRKIFPKLFYARLPKYQAIADEYGCTVTTEALRGIKSESDFLGVITEALRQKQKEEAR
ncbi:MAG: ATPase [Alphaproteobacteria bacterium]